MNNYWYKGQLLLVLVFVLGVIYSIVILNENLQIQHKEETIECEIINKKCHKNRASSITIPYASDRYHVEIENNKCEKLILGDEISLYYNKKYDYFFEPDTIERDKRHVQIMITILFIFLMPLKKLALFFD